MAVSEDLINQLTYFICNETRMPAGFVRTVIEEIEALRGERDAERALADQLASALLDGSFYGSATERRDRMYGSGWDAVHSALEAWEARRG
jgi:hypothetical protein